MLCFYASPCPDPHSASCQEEPKRRHADYMSAVANRMSRCSCLWAGRAAAASPCGRARRPCICTCIRACVSPRGSVSWVPATQGYVRPTSAHPLLGTLRHTVVSYYGSSGGTLRLTSFARRPSVPTLCRSVPNWHTSAQCCAVSASAHPKPTSAHFGCHPRLLGVFSRVPLHLG